VSTQEETGVEVVADQGTIQRLMEARLADQISSDEFYEAVERLAEKTVQSELDDAKQRRKLSHA
jgi:hypothetical protein